MGNLDLNQATTTGMKTAVADYSVSSQTIDEAQTKDTIWQNPDWTKYLGYYKQIPELKKAIDALAMWTVGKGWSADPYVSSILDDITGWGEDSFQSIIWNMMIVKKINGDAFCEIVWEDNDFEGGRLLNLKPLNPSNVRIHVDKRGIIDHYEHYEGTEWRKIHTRRMFHLSNDRVANEIHGTSVVEACQWVIDARNEAMADKRRALHRALIRVLEVDADDTTRLTTLKNQWADAIKNGEVLLLPKDNVTMVDVPPISTAEHSEWIRYLENFFYQAVGVPKIILGGSEEFTEATSKVGYLTFEQPYMTEQRELETDIWNQLFLRVSFDRPASISSTMQSSEAANTGQTGFQANELTPQVGRNE